MRLRRSAEQIYAPIPTIYHRDGDRIFASATLVSSFPRDWPSGDFAYFNGWTRLGSFFADGYFTREDMQELVHNRFGVKL